MRVRDGMSEMVLTVGPGHTLREVAAQMASRNVGAAVVVDPEQPTPGIVTERDILLSVAKGEAPEEERVEHHQTTNIVCASPDWSLEQAASEMVRGRFRHLIVLDGGDVVGILSVRDIVRCWTTEGATSEVA